MRLWDTLEQNFLASRPSESAKAHQLVYRRAVRLMRSKAAAAFDLEEEPAEVRDAYGSGRFGQGCLLARRLVERGVPFVEVSLGGFDNNARRLGHAPEQLHRGRRACRASSTPAGPR